MVKDTAQPKIGKLYEFVGSSDFARLFFGTKERLDGLDSRSGRFVKREERVVVLENHGSHGAYTRLFVTKVLCENGSIAWIRFLAKEWKEVA